ncbi:MAG: broad specificity phosphatase PhoE [Cryomorphaceae bacterium]|jgi:broad specificity phosphatase PhoE
MSTIYLIRHGQASFGQQNYDLLSELGEAQASRLGKQLAKRLPVFDAVVLGTMKRHQQTAENCMAGFGQSLDALSPTYLNGWNEYDHQDILAQFSPEFATAEGMTSFIARQENPKQVFETAFNDAFNRWMSGQHDSDYVESWSAYSERIHAALRSTRELGMTHNNIAVFTSGGPISLVSQHLLGVPAENIMQMNWTLMNCAVTKVVATSSRVFVASLNEHTHFEGAEYKRFITYS